MRRCRLAAVLAAAGVALFAPAGALARVFVEPDVGTGVPVGLSPRAAGTRVTYHGGPVLHANRTHVIFWQPSGSGLAFDPGYQALVERYFTQVAAASHSTTNVYGLTGQYADAGGPAAYASTFGGAVADTDPLPGDQCTEPSTGPPGWAVCLTDDQLQSELQHVIAVDHLPRTFEDIYFMVTPDGFGSCLDSTSTSCALGGADNGYCGYHSQTPSGVFYAVIPYNAISGHCQSGDPRPNGSTADPALSTVAHEQNETITDPEGNAWLDANGEEIADICLQHFGSDIGGRGGSAWNEEIDGGHYYLQELWSDDSHGCAQRAAPDRVSFALPRRVSAGARLSLVGDAADPHGLIVAYDWSFGDGSSSRRRRPAHVFRRAGVYRVVLRVTDSAGNWAFALRVVRVTGRRS